MSRKKRNANANIDERIEKVVQEAEAVPAPQKRRHAPERARSAEAKRRFTSDRKTFLSVLAYLESSRFINCKKRLKVLSYIVNSADSEGIIRESQMKICEKLDVSTIPVHQAFAFLKATGLLKPYGGRGVYRLNPETLHRIVTNCREKEDSEE